MSVGFLEQAVRDLTPGFVKRFPIEGAGRPGPALALHPVLSFHPVPFCCQGQWSGHGRGGDGVEADPSSTQ